MSKVLIWSDLHVHSHKKSTDRLSDCLEVLHWVFKTAIDRKIKHVFFLGDLFHDRTKIEILTLYRVFEVFEKYFTKTQFQLYLLLGNHDLWHRDSWDIHSPVFLKAFPGIQIIDKPSTIKVDGHYVDFLPYTENPINALAELQDFVPKKKNEKRLLCSHLAIDGATLNSFGTESDVVVEHDGDMVKVDCGFLKSWDKVFLGHYHGWQKLDELGCCEYVGSPLQLTFSEAFQDKHIIVFDLETFEQEYIVNDFSPVHLILKPEQLSEYCLDHNFVIVKVDDTSATEIVDMRKDIADKGKVGSLEFKAERKKKSEQDQVLIKDAKAIIESQDQMIERFVDEAAEEKVPGLDRKILLEIGKKIIERMNAA